MAEELLPFAGINPGGENDSTDSDDNREEGGGQADRNDAEMEVVEAEEEVEHEEEAEGASSGDEHQESDEEDDTDEEVMWQPRRDHDIQQPDTDQITFDPALPGSHSYLGNDLEEVRGRTVHEDDTYQTLPILSLPGVVLTPGQTLPLHFFQSNTVALMRRIVEGDKTFGLVTSRYVDHELTISSIGTTAEIFSMKEESDDRAGIATVKVKAMGRQRFEVKESRRTTDGTVMAQVRILPEHILPDQLEGARPASHAKFCLVPVIPKPEQKTRKSRRFSRTSKRDSVESLPKVPNEKKKQGLNRFTCTLCTSWPAWIYKQYYAMELMSRVKQELHSWNETLKAENMPSDPVEFSFWVAGNLPLDDGLKLFLLGIDSAEQRLRCELSIMQRCTVLCCKDCGRLIAQKEDVFSMALEGPLGAYVNPGGHVHETLTVHKAQGLNLIGRPSTEHSWFPGYAWTIVQCNHCASHMGWKFTATKRALHPAKFWGLCRSSLLPGLPDDEKGGNMPDDNWTPCM